jgi:hypothetical protein
VARRAAIALGPEFGTVGAELIREAARKVSRAGFDLLVVCSFIDTDYSAEAFSSVTLTSAAATNHARSSSARSAQRSTRANGHRCARH